MTDDRPRPQYGEYAPEGWVSPNLPAPTPPAPEPEVAPVVAVAPRRRLWDLVLTFALLGLGLYFVLSGYVVYGQLPAVFDQVFAQVGISEFTSDELARTIGIVINVVQTVIWVFVAGMAGMSLRRGRIAFWWPLAGGVLANFIVVILVGVVIASDPAYAEYVSRMTQ